MRPGARAGLAAALLASGLVLAVQYRYTADPHARYDRFDLPAFDPYVYLAMAEHPTVFTVAPWGHRVLAPALARVVPAPNVARGFRLLTVASLLAAAGLLYALLRAHGHGAWGGAAGAAILLAAPPVSEALRLRILVEPLTLALETAFLLLLFTGAGPGLLALALVLGALSKEFFLLLAPLVFVTRWRAQGVASAARATVVAVLPALLATVLLRAWWTPHLPAELPTAETARLALARAAGTWREWAPALPVAGLAPLALLGAWRARGARWRGPALYLAAVTLLPPFFNPLAFFPHDIPRLLIYLLPALVPLALVALDRLWPHLSEAPASVPPPRVVERAAAAAAVLLALSPLALDRYRRIDLRRTRDGPLVLATTRETLRNAARLERGLAVTLGAETHRFVWGESDPGRLREMRWFLREGWGPLAHYGTGPIAMAATEAGLLVPSLRPRDLEAVLEVEPAGPCRLGVKLNDVAIAERLLSGTRERHVLRLPAERLFRGDNLLALSVLEGPPTGLRLHELTLGRAP